VGKIGGRAMVDLAYDEDSAAEVDLNLVMTGSGRFVEIQGTAERYPFDRKDLDEFMSLGWQAIEQLVTLQKNLIGKLD
jgi:ribonuclease PH